MKTIRNIDSLSNPNKQFVSTYGDKFSKIYQNPLSFKFEIDGVEKTVETIMRDIDSRLENSETNIEDIKTKIKDLKQALQEYINTQKKVDTLMSESIDLLNNKYQTLQARVEKLEEKTKFI